MAPHAEEIIEPLPPFVSVLLANRSKVGIRFPTRRQKEWQHSQLRTPLTQRVFSWGSSPYLPDTPSASFYRLYQFFVVDWTIQFRNELDYFWGQASWPLSDLPDPDLEEGDRVLSEEAKLRKAVMAGLTRIMALAYNRLISKGLPRDAPAIVDDWEELKARPRVLEKIPRWAEEMGKIEPQVDLPDKEGKVLEEGEEGDEEFARYGIRVATPHWVFV
ncbi:hypothetical protein B0H34DRAFT_479030 [Crassisporium funariophilum]|nr:hypothetical protein B0H34DRAFT_479030 [Crassisporium funariophilum]